MPLASTHSETHRGSAKKTLSIFMRASWRHRREALLTILMPTGAVLMGVALPFYASTVLAKVAQQQTDLQFPLIMMAVSGVLGVIANRIGFNSMMVMQAKTISDLHNKVFARLLKRSTGYHADRISGKLISDAIDFTNGYATLTSAIGMNGLNLLSNLFIGLVVVTISSWQLGIFTAVIVVVTLLWAWLESRTRSALRANRLIATKNLIAHLSDSIVNVQTVKTFAREEPESIQNKKLNLVLQKLRIKDWQRAGRSGNNRVAVLLAMQFCLVLYVIYLSRHNPAVLGAGIFAFTYTLTLSSRLFDINNLTRQVEEAFLQASPMVAMFDEDIEIKDAPGAKTLKVPRGALELTDVTFGYEDAQAGSGVFEGLSLTVAPGERVGLVGPSGGGKSTLTRLLLRFDEVGSGTISIDGQNINDVTQESLRQAIAYVPQEPLLFHRTIRENISYGKPEANDQAIIRAAKKANAHDFITSLPKGYDTVVGERGVKLSGGQRQRVAIARAILKDAPILILDEATSALDSENEHEVQAALWELMQGRTAIVIAHRLSTIHRMDRIIVLDNGRVVEEGSHQKLLKHPKGLYARLWAHQSGGFLEEE